MSDDLTRAIAEVTEGKDREGTARWPECCRDTYSLAIEEIAAALAPLIEARAVAAEASSLRKVAKWLRDLGHDHLADVLDIKAEEVRRG